MPNSISCISWTLQNPDCLRTALDDLAVLLKEDWDGVDIAEFTITGAGGEALARPFAPGLLCRVSVQLRVRNSNGSVDSILSNSKIQHPDIIGCVTLPPWINSIATGPRSITDSCVMSLNLSHESRARENAIAN